MGIRVELPERFAVSVDVELDFSRRTTRTERVLDAGAGSGIQRIKESSRSASSESGGEDKQKEVEYQLGHEVEQVEHGAGSIRRIQVGVIIDRNLPNVDPAALIRKYPGRFKLMHIKDMKPGVARGSLSGGLPDSPQAVIGQGQVNWPEVMKAAKADGLEHYYLEDETPDPKNNIPPSVAYLAGVRF